MGIYTSGVDYPPAPDKSVYDYIVGRFSFDDDRELFKQPHPRGTKTLSASQFKTQVHQFGLGLQHKLKLKKGDVVLVVLPNCIEFPVVVFGCVFAGLVVAFANPAYTRRELRHIHNLVQPKAIVTVSTLLKIVSAASLPWKDCIVIDTETGYHTTFLKKILASEEEARKAQPVRSDNLDETVYLPCSSGTTGLPKAVMISHRNVVNMVHSLIHIPGLYNEATRALAVAPMYHAMALMVGIHMPLAVDGSSNVIMTRFNPDQFCDLVRDENIDFANLAPPILTVLLHNPKHKQLSRLKLICVGAAPLDAELQRKTEKAFETIISQGHGMTETTVGTLGMRPGQKAGSVGKPMPGVEIRVVDDEGKDVPEGERGEMVIRGKNVFMGYYRNPEATKETFTPDGWLKTGDIVVVDKESGTFAVVDRKKELIKYKGYQVAPAELEGLLLQHPKIAAAAVVGIEDKEQATELPRAYVQLKPDHAKEADNKQLCKDIADFVASRTSTQKRLRGGVRIIERVPMNPSGKILRKEVRQLAKQEEEMSRSDSDRPQARL